MIGRGERGGGLIHTFTTSNPGVPFSTTNNERPLAPLDLSLEREDGHRMEGEIER